MFDCWKNSCHGATVVPDDRDDQQHRGRARAALDPGHDEVVERSGRPCGWAMKNSGITSRFANTNTNIDRSQERKLPLAVIAISSDRGDRHRDVLRDAEVAERQADADELGDDREEVEHEQVADREPAPEASEALVDQPRVADAGDRAEPDDHLLVDDQHRDQQQQHPQQAGAVVLARLGVGGDAAGVVVADHHDQPGADDREQRQRAARAATMAPPRAGGSCRTRPGCRRRGRSRARPARASGPTPSAVTAGVGMYSTSFL